MLAIWEYFWDEAEWTGGTPPSPTPAPTAAPTTSPGAGGGHRPYTPPDEDYWKVRAEYLEYVHRAKIPPAPKPASTIPAAPPPITAKRPAIASLPRYEAERTVAFKLAETATTAKQLRAGFERLRALDTAIRDLKQRKAQRKRALAIARRKKAIALARAFLRNMLSAVLRKELRRMFTNWRK